MSTQAAESYRRDAQALDLALQSGPYNTYFSDEPKGDLESYAGAFVRISKVTSEPAGMTIDVEQFYSGEPAFQAAAKDGASPPNDDLYTRNRYKHSQSVKVAPDVAIVLPYPLDGDRAYGSESFAQLTVVTWPEFLKRLADPDTGVGMRDSRFWITLEDGVVLSIREEYFP